MQKFGIDKAEIPDLARVSSNQNETLKLTFCLILVSDTIFICFIL